MRKMIKSCKFYKNPEGLIAGIKMTLQDDKVWYVSRSPDNTDYQEILEWVDEGNTIEAAD